MLKFKFILPLLPTLQLASLQSISLLAQFMWKRYLEFSELRNRKERKGKVNDLWIKYVIDRNLGVDGIE